MPMSRAFLAKFAVVALLLVAAAWSGFRWVRPQAVVVAARRDCALNAVPAAVTVLAARTLDLKSDAGGRILRSTLELGATVAAGAAVVELDPADLNLHIEQLENDRRTTQRRIEIGSATQFELINTREQLAVSERMNKEGTLPLADLERQRRAVQATEQKLALEKVADEHQLAGIENELKVARRTLEKMTMRSPVDGIVTAIYSNVGDLIGSGQPVATLIAADRIVEARLSEENFAGLRIGEKATVRFLSYGGTQYHGEVVKILPAADPLTQRYVVHLTLEIEPRLLVPGLTGEANIVVDARDNAVIVPRRALFGKNVFVVRNGRVELRTVEPGFISLNEVEILHGVEPGDRVIVEDLDRFRAGDRVTVSEIRS